MGGISDQNTAVLQIRTRFNEFLFAPISISETITLQKPEYPGLRNQQIRISLPAFWVTDSSHLPRLTHNSDENRSQNTYSHKTPVFYVSSITAPSFPGFINSLSQPILILFFLFDKNIKQDPQESWQRWVINHHLERQRPCETGTWLSTFR